VLGRPEHLHGLGRILDRHLVEQNGRGLDEQVGSHHREQRGETILIVGKGSRERRFGRAAARSNDEIDMSNFVAVPDERFADTELVYLAMLKIPIANFLPGETCSDLSSEEFDTCPTNNLVVNGRRFGRAGWRRRFPPRAHSTIIAPVDQDPS